ncbi:hypothetical protein OLG66_19750 [Mycobacterium senegalense]|uniref:hypothetical protein n=1 Tax=Mycolicibacterium senegalense TaxID=1796 RepID=UPI0022223530|nr:hypothetical protein [Mycolicibacterium senegalense]MCW1823158.1 hypothetical protein [Mycolicibacterium senegalense]
MNTHDADIARFRRAAEQVAWEQCHPPVAAVAYIGAAAAAMRNYHLIGGGDTGYTFSDSLIETLTADPLGVQASTELGLLNCLRNEQWVGPMWEQVTARVAEAPMPQVTATERFHRRAAVEHILEHAQPDPAISTAAFAAYVEVMAAARTRWRLGEFAFVEDMDPLDLIRDVIAAEPVAAAADMELDQGRKNYAAGVMAEHWDAIREKASALETASAIAAAVVGPEQRVESARRGARQFMLSLEQEHGVTWSRECLTYAAAVAAGRAQWQENGAHPEQQELFEVQAPALDPASGADLLADETRNQVRRLVAARWAEIAGGTAA